MFGCHRPLSSVRPTPTVRCGYSLLELMLALSLLTALLAVGWSMLSTYRNAEQRGWRLNERVQSIRAARQWLELDLLHLLPMEVSAPLWTATAGRGSNSVISAQEHPFIGDGSGFLATIAPSLDPLPFLQRLLDGDSSDQPESNVPVSEVAATTRVDASLRQPDRSPWPADTLRIEYRLMPDMAPNVTDQNLSSAVWSLVRTELLNPDELRQNISDPSDLEGEIELTAADLYRQTEDDLRGAFIATAGNRLPGLVQPRFRYFDGTDWKDSWNSQAAGAYPRAVALEFDLPDSSLAATQARRARDTASPAPSPAVDPLDPLGGGALLPDLVSQASPGSAELTERQVRIVVAVEPGILASTNPATSSGSSIGGLP